MKDSNTLIMCRRIMAIMLCAFISFAYTPAFVFAETDNAETKDEDASNNATLFTETIKEELSIEQPSVDLDDSDDLLLEFLDKGVSEELEKAPAKPGTKKRANAQSRKNNLSGINLKMYEDLEPMIKAVADGTSDTTAFEMPVLDYIEQSHYTAEDIGVDEIFVQNPNWEEGDDDSERWIISEEATGNLKDTIKSRFDIDTVVNAMLADMPYEFYWFDKTKTGGYSLRLSLSYSAGMVGEEEFFDIGEYSTITVSFCVSSDYSSPEGERGGTAINTENTSAAKAFVDNTATIIENNKNKNNLEKLAAYKEAICTAVEYNDDAVDNDADYGNPWQLIWVFDNNPNTNVVCEGYSKAFQFLCDKSTFSNKKLNVFSVTGEMSGGTGEGRHMWNIVHMPDDNNYMSDITNSDEGTIGSDGQLFMATALPGGDTSNGYQYDCDADESSDVTYVYDEDTRNTFNDKELTMSETPLDEGIEGESIPSAHGITVEIADEEVEEGEYATRELYGYAGTSDINFPYESDALIVGDTRYEYSEEDGYFRNADWDEDYFKITGIEIPNDNLSQGDNTVKVKLKYVDKTGLSYTSDDSNTAYEVDLNVEGLKAPPSSIEDITLATKVTTDDGEKERGSLVGYIGEMKVKNFPVTGDCIIADGKEYAVTDNDPERFISDDGDYFEFDGINEELKEGLNPAIFYFSHYDKNGRYNDLFEYSWELNVEGIADIESITYIPKNPVVIYQGLDGELAEGEEFETEDRYWIYDPNELLMKNGDKIVITKKDKNDQTIRKSFTYDSDVEGGAFVNDDSEDEEDMILPEFTSDSYENPDKWTPGAEGLEFRVLYQGRSAGIPVTLKACPVESVSFTPVEATINASDLLNNMEDKEFSLSNRGESKENAVNPEEFFAIGDKVTIDYTPVSGLGRGVEYTYSVVEDDETFLEFINTDGERIPFWVYVKKIHEEPFTDCVREGVNKFRLQTKLDSLIDNSDKSSIELTVEDDLSVLDDFSWAEPTAYWMEGSDVCIGISSLEGMSVADERFVKSAESTSVTRTHNVEATCDSGGEDMLVPVFENDFFNDYADNFASIEYTDPLGHSMQRVEGVEATCQQEGRETYWLCSRCNGMFGDEEGNTQYWEEEALIIPTSDHNWGDVEIDWGNYDTATATRRCMTDGCSEEENEQAEVSSEVVKQTTCKELGETLYTAVFENENFGRQTKTVTDTQLKEHKEEIMPAEAATCTAGGKTEGKKCSVCNTILKAQQNTEALGHDMQPDAETAKEASCTEEGKEPDKKCSRCEHKEDGAVIPAKGHTELTVAEVPATCEKAGHTAGRKCSVCEEVFDGIDEIPALGHDMQPDAETAKEASCTEEGKEPDKKCSRCDHKEDGAVISAKGHTEEIIPAEAATCTAGGKTEGKKCLVCNTILKAQQNTEALGHDMQPDAETAKEASCTEEGKEPDKKCSRCDHKEDGAVIPAKGHTAVTVEEVPATCEKAGHTAGRKCSVCEEVFDGIDEIPALGHDMQPDAETAKEASCTEQGKEPDKKCSRCDHKEDGAVIPAKGHTEEIIPAEAATCIAGGKTAGKKCSVCNAILEEPKDTSELGHDFSEWTVETEATATEDGLEKRECGRCHIKETRKIDSELSIAQKKAKAEIEAINPDKYSGAEREAVEKAKNDALEAIDKATSVADVKAAAQSAKDTVAAQKTDAIKQAEAKNAADAKKAADELKEWNGTLNSKIPAVKKAKFKAAKKKVTVSWTKANKKNLKKFTHVEVQVCKDKKFQKSNTKRVVVKKTKKSATVKGLKKGTYFVRVRNVKGTGTGKLVSKWSKVKKAKVK